MTSGEARGRADRSIGADRRAVGETASAVSADYRRGVGIVLLNSNNLVFVGHRRDVPQPNGWQMPQGGIDEGETPREAARRELREETGADKVEIIAKTRGWTRYDLPPHLVGVAWGGRWRGQMHRWLLMRFLGDDREIDLATEHPEFSAWKWVTTKEACEIVVPFKRSVYVEVFVEFAMYF